MLDFTHTLSRERIIVALDCSRAEALDLAKLLKGQATWMKVGMTLYYECGPAIVKELKDMGFHVFLDLKFLDIPHQVRGAAASAVRSGADMLTIHSLGGPDMMRAALEGAKEASEALGVHKPVLLGITVLTSMSQEVLRDCGIERKLEDQVISMAHLVQESGLDGVVASPREASILRAALGKDAYIVTPGVRPMGADLGDQHRVANPSEAFAAGASHIVVGRPITAATDPLESFASIAANL